MKQSRLSVLISAAIFLASSAAAQICSSSSNISNFNGTAIQPGNFIWFNANFTASGIPSTGTTISFTGSTITFTADQPYNVTVPNAQITFSPTAACASTTFDTGTNTWVTIVPLAGNDEIFLAGVTFPVPSGFSRVNGPVTWQGTFTSTTPGISVAWKWGAAVYKIFSLDYNALGVKPTHTHACLYNNSDHAGTPEGVDPGSGQPFKDFVVGGARGGGGSNWTGSWSGTAGVSACVNASPPPG
jgi:hypothetical protein